MEGTAILAFQSVSGVQSLSGSDEIVSRKGYKMVKLEPNFNLGLFLYLLFLGVLFLLIAKI